jgi:hypothetical protein
LVVSRSDGDGGSLDEQSGPEGSGRKLEVHHSEPPRGGDGAEINVRLRVGYKTVLLVVVVFDIVHLSLREFVDWTVVENFLGNGP